MQLILYYAPNACSLVPYVTLTEAGAPFEVHPLNFRKSQHMTPEYLRLNPSTRCRCS
jgi:glutathione S-transferase